MTHSKSIFFKTIASFLIIVICSSLSAQDTINATLKYKGRNLHKYIDQYLTYPSDLVEKDIEGHVIIKITVSANGKVTSVDYSGRNHEYFKSILDSLLKPTYDKWKPKFQDGIPIESQAEISVYFSLEKTQNYDKDSSAIEYLIYMKRYRPDPSKDKIRLEQILSKRPGYKEYIEGIEKLEKDELVEAIKMFITAESMGYKDSNLYLNRGIAYLRAKRPNFGCKDWLKSEKYGNKTATEYINDYCKSAIEE